MHQTETKRKQSNCSKNGGNSFSTQKCSYNVMDIRLWTENEFKRSVR